MRIWTSDDDGASFEQVASKQDLDTLRRELKAEVAGVFLYLEHVSRAHGYIPVDKFKAAADLLSPKPAVELPTMEDWKRMSFAFDDTIHESQRIAPPSGHYKRMCALFRLIVEGKARIVVDEP